MLDLLIYFGADPRIRNDRNETYFMKILRMSQLYDVYCDEVEEAQNFIIEFEDNMNEVDIYGNSTLFLAIKFNMPLLEEIVNRGADVNYCYGDINALHLALQLVDIGTFDAVWSKFDYDFVYVSSYSTTTRPLLCDYINESKQIDWLYRFHFICYVDDML